MNMYIATITMIVATTAAQKYQLLKMLEYSDAPKYVSIVSTLLFPCAEMFARTGPLSVLKYIY